MRLITSLLILAIILSIYPAIGEANSLQAWIIELQNEGYKNVEYISGDLFRFCCRDYYGGWLFGIVNSQGKEVVPAIYYEILIESENRIAVYGPQGWCYIDMQGNPINNDHYETVQACFSGGRAWVGKASEEGLLRYFCIDSEGNEISPFGWNYARPFQNGIAIVGTNQISLSNGSFFDDCYQLS